MDSRSLEPELLDELDQDPSEYRASLAMVSQVNRWLGGVRAMKRHLRPLRRRGESALLLDVGTGNGDVPILLRRWAASHGAPWLVIGVDLHPLAASLAHRSGAGPVVRGDGLRLPFPDGSFDAVFNVLMLHHFDDEAAVRLVREMARVSRGLVIVNDLERDRLGHLGALLLAKTLWRRNRLTRNDGPLSVRRSFTATELLDIGRSAGLARPTVQRHFPFRIVLRGHSEKRHASAMQTSP